MLTRIILTSTLFLSVGCGSEEQSAEEGKEPSTMSPNPTPASPTSPAPTSRPSTAFIAGGAGMLGTCPIGIKSVSPGSARVATAGQGRPETDQVVGEGDLLLACGQLYRVARVVFEEGAAGGVGSTRSSVVIETAPVPASGLSLQPDSLVLTQKGRLRLGPGKSTLEELAIADGKATLVVVSAAGRQTIEVRPGEPFTVDGQRLRVLQILGVDRALGVTGWLELERV
jgi:hypothetical protein